MNDRDLERVRLVVREELASLGGHLLRTYGVLPALPAGARHTPADAHLAALGGYLLEAYGQAPPRGVQVEYQAPSRPAVGEPPTTPAPRDEADA